MGLSSNLKSKMSGIMSSSEISYDHVFKVILIGESGVGKTNLSLRFTRNEFDLDSRTTIGVEFSSKLLEVDGKKILAQIWDTAGQEKYQAVIDAFYRNAAGALIVYDITKRISFDRLPFWLDKIETSTRCHTNTLIIGNKSDLRHLRTVPIEEGQQFSDKANLPFLETSALDAINVEEAFESLMKAMYQNLLKEREKKAAEPAKEEVIPETVIKVTSERPTGERIMKNCCKI